MVWKSWVLTMQMKLKCIQFETLKLPKSLQNLYVFKSSKFGPTWTSCHKVDKRVLCKVILTHMSLNLFQHTWLTWFNVDKLWWLFYDTKIFNIQSYQSKIFLLWDCYWISCMNITPIIVKVHAPNIYFEQLYQQTSFLLLQVVV